MILMMLITVISSFLGIIRFHNLAAAGLDTSVAENQVKILLIIIGLVCIVLTIIIALAIRKSIIVPVNEMMATFEQVERGDMTTHLNYESDDEFGRMAMLVQKSFTKQDLVFGDMLAKLRQISVGDLQIEITHEYHGDFKKIKSAIEETVAGLTDIITTIETAAEQVAIGSEQVSNAAQNLAAGSTEQATAIQQLNVSVDSVAARAQENAQDVKIASEYINKSSIGVTDSNMHMQQLTGAMDDIRSSSNRIADIIKIIEDIAFQTNILALNAAVEAARAGAAGKGFAVVADEVRNLAAKSAEATKQTETLIRNSIESVAKGSRLTAETAKILEEVAVNAAQVTDRFDRIEKALDEQTTSIGNIKDGISQVSEIVQTNAHTAQENSATSEEISAQAATLREEVGKFKLNVRRSGREGTALSLRQALPQIDTIALENTADFGKY